MAPVNLGDPDAARAWLDALRAAIDDALAAGHDAARPYSLRVLSRPEARRQLEQAEVVLDELLAVVGAEPRPVFKPKLVLLRAPAPDWDGRTDDPKEPA